MTLRVARSGDRLLFPVRVMPRAASGLVGGERDGALVVRVSAPPVDGAANAAVLRIVARSLGLPPSEVRIVRGVAARVKTLSVPVRSEAALLRLIGPPPNEDH